VFLQILHQRSNLLWHGHIIEGDLMCSFVGLDGDLIDLRPRAAGELAVGPEHTTLLH
jgi:hypothetical protein